VNVADCVPVTSAESDGLNSALYPMLEPDLPPSAAPKAKLDFRLPTDQPCAVAEA
jgi:hypothetical protein